MIRHLSVLFFASLILVLGACSSKKKASVDITSTSDTTTTDATYQDPFTQTYTSSPIISGNLFDTSNITTSTTTTTQTVTPVTASTTACLTGSDPFSSTGCVNNPFGADTALDFMAGSFGEMNFCYQAVITRASQVFQQTTLAASEYPVIFQQAGAALVRCYNQIVQNQQNLAQWNQEQQRAFQQQQQNLQLMLSYLAQLQALK